MCTLDKMLLSCALGLIQASCTQAWRDAREQTTKGFEVRVLGAICWICGFDRHYFLETTLRETLENR